MDDLSNLSVQEQTLEYTKRMYHDMHFFFRMQKIHFWMKTIFGVLIVASLVWTGIQMYKMVHSVIDSKFVQNIQSLGSSAGQLNNSDGKIQDFIQKYLGK